MAGPARFHVETLGCPMNAVDSDKVTASLLADGLVAAASAAAAGGQGEPGQDRGGRERQCARPLVHVDSFVVIAVIAVVRWLCGRVT